MKGSRSVPQTNGFGRPKNLRFRIRNTEYTKYGLEPILAMESAISLWFGSVNLPDPESIWRRIPDLDLYRYAILYFLFDPFRLVESETCKALRFYQCTESCLKNYFSTCMNIYRSFPGEMSSLENDLADLQNFLIKQSQVRKYAERNIFGSLAAVFVDPDQNLVQRNFLFCSDLDPELPFWSRLRIRIWDRIRPCLA